MPEEPKKKRVAPGIIPILTDDIRHGSFFSDFKREMREIEDFYLSQDERDRLNKMGKIGRGLTLAFWLLENSIRRLTPFRRVLLFVGLILEFLNLSFHDVGYDVDLRVQGLGAVCLLFIIVLELKDKLLVRSELESGRAIQLAMSPERTPAVSGWSLWLYSRSANEVGGDLLDFLRLSDGRFGISVGDVAGKGLSAALFMVKIQSWLRALAPDSQMPDELAAKLNTLLIRHGIPGKFASLVYAEVESTTGNLRMVNAGHMPPLVLGADVLTELPKGNGALGLASTTKFETSTLTVKPGEYFIIYSDGLTEAQNEQGEFYGFDRFRALCLSSRTLSPQQFGERILSEVSAFEGEARRTDDLSLLILRKES
jgi:hypothetical protein